MKTKKSKRKYWYRMYVGECPVCGSDKSWRERVYGVKPKKISKRYVRIPDSQTFDNCI